MTYATCMTLFGFVLGSGCTATLCSVAWLGYRETASSEKTELERRLRTYRKEWKP